MRGHKARSTEVKQQPAQRECAGRLLTPQVGKHGLVHRELQKINGTFVSGDLKNNDIPLLQGDCNLFTIQGQTRWRDVCSTILVINTTARYCLIT